MKKKNDRNRDHAPLIEYAGAKKILNRIKLILISCNQDTWFAVMQHKCIVF